MREYKKEIIKILKNIDSYIYEFLLLEKITENDISSLQQNTLDQRCFKNLEKWLDGYFLVKDNLEKYAPNLLEHGTNNYFKENPLVLKNTDIENITSSSSNDRDRMDISYIVKKLPEILENELKEDPILAKQFIIELKNIFNEAYPKNNYYQHHLNNIVINFDNEFFKEYGFDVYEEIRNNHILSFDFSNALEIFKINISNCAKSDGKLKNSPATLEFFNKFKDFEFKELDKTVLNNEQKNDIITKRLSLLHIQSLEDTNRENKDIYYFQKRIDLFCEFEYSPEIKDSSLKEFFNYAKKNIDSIENLAFLIEANIKKRLMDKATQNIAIPDKDNSNDNRRDYAI